jgi:hypothetical protein
LDAQLTGHGRILVDVYLHQADLARLFIDHLLDGGGQLAAGTAPWSPEIDQDRRLVRGVDDIGLEAAVGRFPDQHGGGGRGLGGGGSGAVERGGHGLVGPCGSAENGGSGALLAPANSDVTSPSFHKTTPR